MAEKKGFWASLMPSEDELGRGMVDATTTMKVFKDGTFTIKGTFGGESAPDRLVAFEIDSDSMRRKSTTGRGGAALMTGGLSLLASNNRGVSYVTVTGANSGVRTYTTKNPGNTQLTSMRTLQAAAASVVGQSASSPAGGSDSVAQLKQLADLHAAGALSDEEFAAAKKRILG
jgi:hypothetical protein